MRVKDMRGHTLEVWVKCSFYEDAPAGWRVVIPVLEDGTEDWQLAPLPFDTNFSDAERVGIFELPDTWRAAHVRNGVFFTANGPTPAIAAARTYVMAVFGEEVPA
ncbi:hypothetical protein G3N59_01205 [Paraburkholderia sp. Ac-20340]|uniref:hypothetical protein n=1 Tax=Paraburkholderia sp. Ac-20340 TaxID=2703888 RepID=UPI0019801E4F|nr:hypothetical protein [Paraburkholderia sp. Ac-20340]MBN3851985.1 hypothetical protein [Paraburkholderia sp. Ac-20340]